MENVAYKEFEVEKHLPGVLALCEAEGWKSFAEDPERTRTSLTAPGVNTLVAIECEKVVGFAQIQSDGVLQSHLSLVAVDASFRGAASFYESFVHETRRGYRIYPQAIREA